MCPDISDTKTNSLGEKGKTLFHILHEIENGKMKSNSSLLLFCHILQHIVSQKLNPCFKVGMCCTLEKHVFPMEQQVKAKNQI